MAIKESNTRLIITVPKEMKEQLEVLAETDGRSVSNLINIIIKQYLDDAIPKRNDQ